MARDVPNADESPVLTVAQAAKLLQVSENHLYSLIAQNLVPHVRFGKLIRIPRWALLQHLASASGSPLAASQGLAFLPGASVHGRGQEEEA